MILSRDIEFTQSTFNTQEIVKSFKYDDVLKYFILVLDERTFLI